MEEKIVKELFSNWVDIIEDSPQKFLDKFDWCNIITANDYWINFACDKLVLDEDIGEMKKVYINIKYYENEEEIVIKNGDDMLFDYVGKFSEKKLISNIITSISDFVIPVFEKNKQLEKEEYTRKERERRAKKLSFIKEELI